MTSNRPSSAHSFHHQASTSPSIPIQSPHTPHHHYPGGHHHQLQYNGPPMGDYRHSADPNRHGALPPHTGSSHHPPPQPHAPQPHLNGPSSYGMPRERDFEYDRGHPSGNGAVQGQSTPKGAEAGRGAGGYWREQDGPPPSTRAGHAQPASSGTPMHAGGAQSNGHAGSPAASVATPPPASLGSGIKLNFKRPAAVQDGEKVEDSDAEGRDGKGRETDSPGSAGGSSRKRRKILE